MSDILQGIANGLTAGMERLQKTTRQNLEDQGHVLTGRLRDSIVFDVVVSGDKVKATMYCEAYGLAMEFGIKAANIPYSSGSGAASSQYIQGLITYFKRRGVTGREGIRAAFATARKHKREGMPTHASRRFSKTGERTGFASSALESDLEFIGAVLQEKTGFALTIAFVPGMEIEPIKIFV